jgi:hypothetical protein
MRGHYFGEEVRGLTKKADGARSGNFGVRRIKIPALFNASRTDTNAAQERAAFGLPKAEF